MAQVKAHVRKGRQVKAYTRSTGSRPGVRSTVEGFKTKPKTGKRLGPTREKGLEKYAKKTFTEGSKIFVKDYRGNLASYNANTKEARERRRFINESLKGMSKKDRAASRRHYIAEGSWL